MTDESQHPSPPRLLHSSTAMAALLNQVESEYREDLDEARAWHRLRARLNEECAPRATPPRIRRWYWAAAAIAAGFFVGWFGWNRLDHAPSVREAPVATPDPRGVEVAPTIQLATGTSLLPDGTEVRLAEGARGVYHAEKQRSTLEFDSGRMQIAVAKQTDGRQFVVKAQSYEFVVLGTKFDVVVAGAHVDLDVTEGRVAVHDATQTLRIVEAGGHWSNHEGEIKIDAPAVSATPPSPIEHPTKLDSALPSTAAPADASSCRDALRGGNPRQAERCYAALSVGSGLSAEMALYEVARLRRDVLASAASALSALEEYEGRFPSGTLAPEVRMARVDLLARLGRVDEALTASEQLLGSSSGRARQVELRLLRGNLLAEKKRDCAAAILEYQRIESDPGPRGDQAQLARARCLEQLGRFDDARHTYESYLTRPNAGQAERARQRLEELQR